MLFSLSYETGILYSSVLLLIMRSYSSIIFGYSLDIVKLLNQYFLSFKWMMTYGNVLSVSTTYYL